MYDDHQPADAMNPGPADQPAGWYRDPWSDGYRYWDGTAWTSAWFAGIPAGPSPWAAPGSQPAQPAQPPWAPTGSVPPPQWTWPAPGAPPLDPQPPPLPSPPPSSSSSSSRRTIAIVVAVGLAAGLVGTAAGAGIAVAVRRDHHRTTAATTVPARPTFPGGPRITPPTTVPADPSAASLASVVLTQKDVPSSVNVATIPGGDRVTGQVTLDLCDGDFPSEDLRTARLQVAADNDQGNIVLSTEAVLYQDPGATEQAFRELRSVAASCPATTAKFNPAPDGAWPQTPTVERLAFDFNLTDPSGQQTHGMAVYLRRGRALLGVYFNQPETVPAVNGSTDVGQIVALFAGRLAALPASVVGA